MPLGQAEPAVYQDQLDRKITLTKEEFRDFFRGDLDVYPSPASHFRMRAEFKVWQKDGTAHYAMYQPGEYKRPVILDWEFSIGSRAMVGVMAPLMEAINGVEKLRTRLFQIEFLTTTTGEILVTLIYHKPLDDEWQQLAEALAGRLEVMIIGRSRKQKRVLDRDYVFEKLSVDGDTYTYQQVESGFTQPNAAICEAMLNWAVAGSRDWGGDLLELYCGNGNFTLPLSKNFDRVLATEISKTSVRSAEYNMALNQCDNIAIARMSSEEFTEALNGVREFRRLSHVNLDEYRFTSVFVDPPRAGLDSDTTRLISRFDNILYISCNPSTLRDNLEQLSATHQVVRLALFDQFPYTDHRECGVLLQRK